MQSTSSRNDNFWRYLSVSMESVSFIGDSICPFSASYAQKASSGADGHLTSERVLYEAKFPSWAGRFAYLKIKNLGDH
jgi:hypothetical protein